MVLFLDEALAAMIGREKGEVRGGWGREEEATAKEIGFLTGWGSGVVPAKPI